MSPNQGKRPTLGRGGSGGAGGRSSGPAPVRRLGLLVFGAVFVILFAVVAIAQGIGQPSVPSGDVVIVEDAPGDTGAITEAEFQRGLEQTAVQAGLEEVPKPGDEQYEDLRETTLGSLLDTVWIQGQAEEMGISATPKEVTAEFKTLKDQNFESGAEYREFLKGSKFTQADVDERVKLQLLSTQVQEEITAGAPAPSESEIEGYYDAAKSTQLTQPATRDARIVANDDKKKAGEAKARLEKDSSAASWGKVAKKYSADPAAKENGGLQTGLAEGAVEEPLNEALFNAPQGKVEGLVKGPGGYFVFEVEDVTPENVQTLAEARPQIESTLSQQAEQDAFAKFVGNFGSTWRSRTFCAPDYLNERCANFKGDGRPAAAPPACYEANPEGGVPDACPAPVFQLIPALPGSVSLLAPKGQPLAQRPRPTGLEPVDDSAELPTAPTAPPVSP